MCNDFFQRVVAAAEKFLHGNAKFSVFAQMKECMGKLEQMPGAKMLNITPVMFGFNDQESSKIQTEIIDNNNEDGDRYEKKHFYHEQYGFTCPLAHLPTG